jgi:hypothetical protein
MRASFKWWLATTASALAVMVLGCSDSAPTGPETPIPSLSVQQIGACAQWSCAIADCTNDPAIYGACCVAVADEGEPTQPKPSCGNPNTYPAGHGCGPQDYDSQEIYAAGCYCPVSATCCYYNNPSSLDPSSC